LVGVGVLTIESEGEVDEVCDGRNGRTEDGVVERDIFVNEAGTFETFIFVFDEAVTADLNGGESGHEPKDG
jgi:hypothetical protein